MNPEGMNNIVILFMHIIVIILAKPSESQTLQKC
jgi:hypothetical protein